MSDTETLLILVMEDLTVALQVQLKGHILLHRITLGTLLVKADDLKEH